MSEEEKKAIAYLKSLIEMTSFIKDFGEFGENNPFKILNNLIGKQQKEIEEYEKNRLWSEATINGLKNDFVTKQKIKDILDNKYIAFCEGYGEFPDNKTKLVKYIKSEYLEELLKEE